jgi:hypothetical protein
MAGIIGLAGISFAYFVGIVTEIRQGFVIDN